MSQSQRNAQNALSSVLLNTCVKHLCATLGAGVRGINIQEKDEDIYTVVKKSIQLKILKK